MGEPVIGLIPHAGAMCLLDEVIAWRSEHIHCRAGRRALAGHPLRDSDTLPATALIEYAAQATAAHGTLLARSGDGGAVPASGRLVALRRIELAADTAWRTGPELPALDVHAERVMADAAGSVYAFHVEGDSCVLARGRLTVRTLGDSHER